MKLLVRGIFLSTYIHCQVVAFNQILSLPHSSIARHPNGVRGLSCRIIEISRRKTNLVAPARVSREQWAAYWGMNQIERLQKVMECVLFAYGGAWLAWFTSFMAGQLVASIIGTATVFNWIYNPWLYAKKRNAKLWPRSRKFHYAIYSARIKGLSRIKRRAANTIGGISPEFLEMILEDEYGRKLDILTQWQQSYSQLRIDMLCETVICSPASNFEEVLLTTEVWVPACDVWVGDYPYLNRKEFRKLIVQTGALKTASETVSYYDDDGGSNGEDADGDSGTDIGIAGDEGDVSDGRSSTTTTSKDTRQQAYNQDSWNRIPRSEPYSRETPDRMIS